MEEPCVTVDVSVPSHGKSSEIPQPSNGSFHDPPSPVTSQFSSILIGGCFVVAAGRDNGLNMSFLEGFPNLVTVVPAVSDKSFWPSPRPSRTRTFHFDGVERFLKERDLRRGRRVQVCSQRSTRAIDQYHPLCSLPAFGLTHRESPFFAGAKLPSAKHSFHRIFSLSCNWVRNARQSSRSVPSCSHCWSRLQHVLGLPYSFGSSLQGAPVQRIQRIPLKHFRASTRGRPPFGRGAGGGR
jgi:hypothetical protein